VHHADGVTEGMSKEEVASFVVPWKRVDRQCMSKHACVGDYLTSFVKYAALFVMTTALVFNEHNFSLVLHKECS
jgi:hypothetical protein